MLVLLVWAAAALAALAIGGMLAYELLGHVRRLLGTVRTVSQDLRPRVDGLLPRVDRLRPRVDRLLPPPDSGRPRTGVSRS
jgi:hypothetical protein